jgi:hypothetical protein
VKQSLIIGTGAILGGALLYTWWSQYGSSVSTANQVLWGWLGLGVSCAALSLWLQIVRTARLIKAPSLKSIQAVVLVSHGMNVLLPSLLGDAYEVTAFAKRTKTSAKTILIRLIHRFTTTVSALGMLLAGALFSVQPNSAFAVLVVACGMPFVVDQCLPTLAKMLSAPIQQPFGGTETAIHMVVAWCQHAVSAAGVFCLGLAIDDAVSPASAAAMLSMADAVTYLPVPLGGVGLNHWGITALCDFLGRIPAALIAFNHGLVVLIGGVSVGIGLATQPQAMHNS